MSCLQEAVYDDYRYDVWGASVKLLPKWFVAIWIETNHRKGVLSVQLAKLIGTPQKTFLLQRIRQAAGKEKDNDDDNLLDGRRSGGVGNAHGAEGRGRERTGGGGADGNARVLEAIH